MGRVKNLLKRIFPAPHRTFMKEVNALKKQNTNLSKKVSEQDKQIEDLKNQLESMKNDINREFASVNNSIIESGEKTLSELQTISNSITKSNQAIIESQKVEAEAIIGQLQDGVSAENTAFVKVEQNIKKELLDARENIKRYSLENLDPSLYPHALKEWYQNRTGKVIDLDNPKTFNEKIQWSKLYDRNPLKTRLADKYLVREWVKETIGEQYLIPLIGVYNYPEEINYDELPDRFVIKANHGSGMNAIVRDKNKEDLKALNNKLAYWLRNDFTYRVGFELQYRDIPRKIIIEEYMENADGDMPDYKIFCFDGKVKFIEVVTDRRNGGRCAYYDMEWNMLPFHQRTYPLPDAPIAKPSVFEEMINVAEKLSTGFPHVRVDLYVLSDTEIKFGEMTFSSGSGVTRWVPESADLEIGKYFILPKQN